MTTAEEELARKVNVRAGHRASTTRRLTQAQTALDADPIDLTAVEQCITTLTRKLRVLTSLDEDILELTPQDAIDNEIERADQYQEDVQGVLAKLSKSLAPPPAPATTRPPAAPLAVPVTTPPAVITPAPGGRATTAVHATRVKLPRLTLPHFSGNPAKWTTFWDSFESAIHSNTRLSEVDKFNYLRSLLEGSAFEAIKGLTLSAASYQDAVAILKRRFGNKQLIVSNQGSEGSQEALQ